MTPRVLVCQRGARRRYAVPHLLEEAGMLAALYTDSTAYSLCGRFGSLLGSAGIKLSKFRALAARVPPGIPRHKVYSSDKPLLSLLQNVGGDEIDLSGTYKKWGLQQADLVYSMYGEDASFLEYAKSKGLKVIVDVFVHPLTNRIMHQECSAYPAAEQEASKDVLSGQDAHSGRAFDVADILIAPSSWVAEGIVEFAPQHESKIRIVPYGSSIQPLRDEGSPRENIFLFAGRDPLRKGLPYLAEAASMVHEQYPDWKICVAGLDESEISWIPHREHLTCLGRVPLAEMRELYTKAWAFVMPSLSEGQAAVILEALACGCPVIATRESGVDFGPDAGTMVPSRDSKALASAMLDLIDNDEVRHQRAAGALEEAFHYTTTEWKDRLVNLMIDLGDM